MCWFTNLMWDMAYVSRVPNFRYTKGGVAVSNVKHETMRRSCSTIYPDPDADDITKYNAVLLVQRYRSLVKSFM